MVDVRVLKHGFEVLATATPEANSTRFVAEVLHDQQPDPTANIEVLKHSIEVISEGPIEAKTTRFVAEVLHDQQPDPTANLEVLKHGIEVIAEAPIEVQTTRFVAEVLHDQQPDPTANIEVLRTGFEVLARKFITILPCPVPAFWRWFSHNFIDRFDIETTYRTAISRGALSLSEDRTQTHERPRRTVKVRWSEQGMDDKRNLMDLMQVIRQMKTEDWMTPLESDSACLTTALTMGDVNVFGDFSKRRFFTGMRVAVVKMLGDRADVQDENGDLAGVHLTTIASKLDDSHFVLDDSVPFSTLAFQAKLVPMMCTLPRLQDTIRQIHNRLWDLDMEFEERGGETAIPPTADDNPPGFDVYRDVPIFRPRHDYSNPLNIQILQEGEQIPIGRGKETFLRGDTQRVKHIIHMAETREVGWDYVRFFDTRRGRLRPFYLIDQEDLFFVTDIEPNFIDVNKLGDFTEFQKDMEFFGFMLKDGTCFVREVLNITDLPTAWRISLVDTLPSGLAFQDVCVAGRARLTRMLEDSFKERWHHNDVVEFNVRTISLLAEQDITLDP